MVYYYLVNNIMLRVWRNRLRNFSRSRKLLEYLKYCSVLPDKRVRMRLKPAMRKDTRGEKNNGFNS